MGEDILGLVVLGSIRKQVEQIMRSKPVSNTTLLHDLCIGSCFQGPALFEYLYWFPSVMNSDEEV